MQSSSIPSQQPPAFLSDDFDFNWHDSTDEDSDYITWDSNTTPRVTANPRSSSGSGCETFISPQPSRRDGPSATAQIPLPPFSTPPKLQPVEKVFNSHPGSDVASL